MVVPAFYDQGVYDDSYYDNLNPAETIEISEQSYTITSSETERIEET